jgi:hypothetical protein
MNNDIKQIQEKLESWAEETVKVYNSIAETLNKKNPNKNGVITHKPHCRLFPNHQIFLS